jgi:hypothetical protein
MKNQKPSGFHKDARAEAKREKRELKRLARRARNAARKPRHGESK